MEEKRVPLNHTWKVFRNSRPFSLFSGLLCGYIVSFPFVALLLLIFVISAPESSVGEWRMFLSMLFMAPLYLALAALLVTYQFIRGRSLGLEPESVKVTYGGFFNSFVPPFFTPATVERFSYDSEFEIIEAGPVKRVLLAMLFIFQRMRVTTPDGKRKSVWLNFQRRVFEDFWTCLMEEKERRKIPAVAGPGFGPENKDEAAP